MNRGQIHDYNEDKFQLFEGVDFGNGALELEEVLLPHLLNHFLVVFEPESLEFESSHQALETLVALLSGKFLGKTVLTAEAELHLEILDWVGIIELKLDFVGFEEDDFRVKRVARVFEENLVVLGVEDFELEGLLRGLQEGHLDFELADCMLFVLEYDDLALEGLDGEKLEAGEDCVFGDVFHVAVRGNVHEKGIFLEFEFHFLELFQILLRTEGLKDNQKQ